MKSISSDEQRPQEQPERKYFCTEPWTGIFSVETNRDVTFCPCYLRMKIGNLDEGSMQEIWNSEQLQELRASFRDGILPEPCHGQSCPPVLGEGDSAS
jgi:radical SAM protein with 4Fe4S-binding SPASM domain